MPNGQLAEGPDGYLYGTTMFGGAVRPEGGTGGGVFFKVSKTETFQNLHTFCNAGTCDEGITPSGLVLGRDGKFYGTTPRSGSAHPNTFGSIFRISAAGVIETLHNFVSIPEGSDPMGGVVQGSDCNFYGATFNGGADNNSAGTIFRFSPGGVLTTLYVFSSASGSLINGRGTHLPLTLGSNGKLYGDY